MRKELETAHGAKVAKRTKHWRASAKASAQSAKSIFAQSMSMADLPHGRWLTLGKHLTSNTFEIKAAGSAPDVKQASFNASAFDDDASSAGYVVTVPSVALGVSLVIASLV